MIPSATTLALAAAKLTGVVIGWQIVEHLGGTDADFVFGPAAFDLSKAGSIGSGQPSAVQPGVPVVRIETSEGSTVVRLVSQGTPGLPQWIIEGFASPAAYTAALAAAAASLLSAWQPISADHQAADGDNLLVDTTAGQVTITLPAGGGTVTFRDPASSWPTHPMQILGNGRTIDGQPSSPCAIGGYEVTLTSVGATWRYALTYLYGG